MLEKNHKTGIIDSLLRGFSSSESQVGRINVIFTIFLGFGFIAVYNCAADAVHRWPALLWGLACLAVGAVIGLLFGIPRMRQKNNTPKQEPKDAEVKYQPEINNNLIEVSDWLTKIIVGVGLIELKSIPSTLKQASRPLEICLGSQCSLSVAVGIIVYFSAAGFLVGYINARTFIAVLFRRSDDELLEDKVTALETRVELTATKQQAQEVTSELKLQGMQTMVETSTAAAPADSAAGETTPPDTGLLRMARDYEAINDNSYRVRVAKKDRAATAMVRYIITSKIPKNTLLRWVASNPTDGMILAYASYVLSNPARSDLNGLLQLSRSAGWLHVKFRVTLAFRALSESGYGEPEEWSKVIDVLEEYKESARKREDSPLMTLAQEVADLIRTRSTQ
jgi:hypothetical protein